MYNEETNAGIILPLLQRALAKLTNDYEIVIVDDASRDRTVPLVEDYAQRDSRIRLVRHEKNEGYGTALRTGFKSATKDIVFYTDADVPIDFAILDDVIPQMEKHPVIIGFRIDRHDTPKRWIFSLFYNRLLRFLFGVRVRDINFSFKVFRKEVVDTFKNELQAHSVFIDGEILIHLVRKKIPIHEWPVEYTPRKYGLSTLGTFRQVKITLKEIFEFYFRPRGS
jgi:glycosyltransferase involved in cell wall biosynthesis